MNKKVPVITIDGPSGSGKGTISQLLARQLHWHFLDSGALYRVLGLAARQHKIALNNEQALTALVTQLDVQFIAKEISSDAEVILEGLNVTQLIRTPESGNAASEVAALPGVRSALLERQRAFRQAPGLVADGRDMGNVVFPDAQLKVFLIATPEERAKRRYVQLQEKGLNVSLEQVLAELIERDRRDTERSVSPLQPAKDAWILDTTELTINEVFSSIMHKVKNLQ